MSGGRALWIGLFKLEGDLVKCGAANSVLCSSILCSLLWVFFFLLVFFLFVLYFWVLFSL